MQKNIQVHIFVVYQLVLLYVGPHIFEDYQSVLVFYIFVIFGRYGLTSFSGGTTSKIKYDKEAYFHTTLHHIVNNELIVTSMTVMIERLIIK